MGDLGPDGLADHIILVETQAAAMAKTGHISPSNSVDLKKVSWSRSSRTDKGESLSLYFVLTPSCVTKRLVQQARQWLVLLLAGVHALAGVVALKMELKADHDFAADPEGLACAQVPGALL